jgi:hypothetical protein
MNKRALMLAGLLFAAPARAETLAQAVDEAYASNPVFAAARARQQGLEEAPEQARTAGRLTAAADAAAGYDKFDYGKGAAGTVSADLPIWTGGRVSSAVRAAEGDVAAGAEGLRDSEAALLTDVIGAYAELLYGQQAADIAQADIALLDHQVAEAKARYGLGQATRTDVAQLEAQRASAVATLADAQARLATTAAAPSSAARRGRWRRRRKASPRCPPASIRRGGGRSTPIRSIARASALPTPPRRGSIRRGPAARPASRWAAAMAMTCAPRATIMAFRVRRRREWCCMCRS